MEGLGINIILMLIIAGFGAGVVTGLAGASAATVVTPLLVTFTPIVAYTAVAISLITDVFASFFSFLTYRKAGNINMKDGVILTITACIGSVMGSYLSTYMNNDILGTLGGAMTLLLGFNFLWKGYHLHQEMKKQKEDPSYQIKEKKKMDIKGDPKIVSGLIGVALGLVCGIIGAGGGLMILFVLTGVLGYDTKTAIGTSVLIMTFTALTGGVAHFLHIEDLKIFALLLGMAITSISAVIGARIAAAFANRTTEDILLTLVGAIFVFISGMMIIQKIL